ncbi:MAG: CBS domain-containing protein [Aliidiomarina sp.]|uniref:CBS domain-containing protein n=1 Tax=Aliidiomarina sp. TaxID=1872439 RepID=UPI0025C2890C|nr:CBS domain-containing protein [Aliidiomarina sp.]MCH8501330.1 CBS domain-containing protein [Aliidiomarina sp.]
MQVKDVMIKDVVTISPFAKLREALSLLKSKNIKSLVVEKQSDSDAYGLITYTNVLKTVIAEDGDIDLLNVYDICAKPALAVGASLSLKQCAAMMVQQHVKRLLVLKDNELEGFVTMDDIMGELLKKVD